MLIFHGNLGRDPEMRYTPSGQTVCSFSVAESRSYKNRDGESVKETTWYRVSTWGKLAEICATYLKKGTKVLVEGRLTPDKETGGPKIYQKQDGTSAAGYDVTASSIEFLSPVVKNEKEESQEEIPF